MCNTKTPLMVVLVDFSFPKPGPRVTRHVSRVSGRFTVKLFPRFRVRQLTSFKFRHSRLDGGNRLQGPWAAGPLLQLVYWPRGTVGTTSHILPLNCQLSSGTVRKVHAWVFATLCIKYSNVTIYYLHWSVLIYVSEDPARSYCGRWW